MRACVARQAREPPLRSYLSGFMGAQVHIGASQAAAAGSARPTGGESNVGRASWKRRRFLKGEGALAR